MKFSQYAIKVALGLGFSSLHDMDRSDANMDLCWGNGMDNDKASQLYDEIVYSAIENRDADQLLYYFCLTAEGAKKLIDLTRTFGGNDKIANALIRGLDYRLSYAGESRPRTQEKMDTILGVLGQLIDGKDVPYSALEKPDRITDLRFWKLITRNCRDLGEIVDGLEAHNFSAARYFLEKEAGQFIDQSTMEDWSFPGYMHTAMPIPNQVTIYKFLAKHIGERKAFMKVVDPNTMGDSVAELVKEIGKLESLDHWKAVFHIDDCVDFLNTSSDRAPRRFLHDLLACSISASSSDIEQLRQLKKSSLSKMIDRGCVEGITAMLLAGKRSALKGKILENDLGM